MLCGVAQGHIRITMDLGTYELEQTSKHISHHKTCMSVQVFYIFYVVEAEIFNTLHSVYLLFS